MADDKRRFRYAFEDIPDGTRVEFTERGEPGFNDSWLNWLARAIEEEEPDPDVQRYWDFMMGRTTEDVTLVQVDKDGMELKRWLLRGCRCTESPEQRAARGEPAFEAVSGDVEVTQCVMSFVRREVDDVDS